MLPCDEFIFSRLCCSPGVNRFASSAGVFVLKESPLLTTAPLEVVLKERTRRIGLSFNSLSRMSLSDVDTDRRLGELEGRLLRLISRSVSIGARKFRLGLGLARPLNEPVLPGIGGGSKRVTGVDPPETRLLPLEALVCDDELVFLLFFPSSNMIACYNKRLRKVSNKYGMLFSPHIHSESSRLTTTLYPGNFHIRSFKVMFGFISSNISSGFAPTNNPSYCPVVGLSFYTVGMSFTIGTVYI